MSPPSDGPAGRFAMQHKHPQILDGLLTDKRTKSERRGSVFETEHAFTPFRLGI
jgi:hypothetical protein